MNKKELIEELAKTTGVSQADATKVLNALPDLLGSSLLKDARVVIPGIGIATLKDRAERIGRNPKTGEPMTIAARKVISIKASKGFAA
jgi:DNA-binding protein HU-beta